MLTTEWGPVGTRGGCGAGRGPCACPRGNAIQWGSVRQDGRTPTRTSTRPPHPLHPAPCPYRTLGRKHLNGYDSPIRSATFSRAGPCWWFVVWKCLVACLFLEESQQPTCPHSRQRRRCTLILPLCGVAGRWTLITEPRDAALPHLGPQEGQQVGVELLLLL